MANTPPQYTAEELRLRQIIVDALQKTAEIQEQINEAKRESSELDEEAGRKAQTEFELELQNLEIREKLHKLELGRLGVIGGIGRLLKNNVEFAKELAKRDKQVADYEKLSHDIGKRIGELDKTKDKALIAQLSKKKALYDTEIELNKAMLAGAGTVSIFGKSAAAVGKTLNSGVFQAGLFIANIFFKMMGILWSVIKSVVGFLYNQLKKVLEVFLQFQSLAGNLAADLGLSNIQTRQLFNNMRGIGESALRFGVTMEEAFGFMRKFSEATGINRVFLGEQVAALSQIAKATGLGVEATGEMYAKMELVGYSTDTFLKYVQKVRGEAAALNLNIGKVLKTVNELLPAFYGLNFAEGLEGMTKLVEKAQGLRFSLENMRSIANKVFNPEGAIELAAHLRILGGSFARIADPFSLMMKGQADAAGLMEDIMSTMAGLATKNKEGIFTIPPVQQALIREAATAMGENADNMIRGALQMAKQADIVGKLRIGGILTEGDKTLIANLAEMEGGEYKVRVNAEGLRVAIQDLTPQMLDNIREYQKAEEVVARNRMNIMEQLRNIYQRFLVALAPVFEKISRALTDNNFLNNLGNRFIEFGTWLGQKIESVINSGALVAFFDKTKIVIESLIGILQGSGDFITKIGKVIGEVLTYALKTLIPAIIAAVRATGMGETVSKTAGIFGALGGAGIGTLIAAAIAAATGVGAAAVPFILAGGALAGGVVGGGLGYGGTKSIIGSQKAGDFIYRAKDQGRIMQFDENDTVLGYKESKMKTPMIPSVAPINQKGFVKYGKEQFNVLNMYMNPPAVASRASMDLNLGGTILVKGDAHEKRLTDADFEKMSIEQVAQALLLAIDRQNNHSGSNKLPNQIVTPIRSTSTT